MIVRNPPESWFWSHDIEPGYFDDVVTPGTRMQRLSNYGKGARGGLRYSGSLEPSGFI